MYKIIGGDGKEYGPVTAEQLRQWIAEGRANAQTQAQPVGGTGWQPLGTIPEFASAFGAPAAPPPPSAAGAPLPPTTPLPVVPDIPNYLWQSIVVTLCCCPPLGIPAIVFAAQVNSKLRDGDVLGAQDASRKAKMWCWIAFGLGLLANIIGFFIGFLGQLAAHRRF
jgi:hypothetical protein